MGCPSRGLLLYLEGERFQRSHHFLPAKIKRPLSGCFSEGFLLRYLHLKLPDLAILSRRLPTGRLWCNRPFAEEGG